jgi:hypothetical protein
MPKPVKKKRKPPKDINQWARHVVDQSTAEPETEVPLVIAPAALSAYMSALGRKGGKIGGKRRMNAMTDPEKSALALKAATARWSKGRREKKR